MVFKRVFQGWTASDYKEYSLSDEGEVLYNHEIIDLHTDYSFGIYPVPIELVLKAEIVSNKVAQLRAVSELSEKKFDELIYPIVVLVSEYLHFLPLTEWHHYQGQAGALRHSLDVACMAVNEMVTTLSSEKLAGKHSEDTYEKLVVVTAIAALMDDFHAPFSRLKVVDNNGDIWSKDEPLYKWLVKQKSKRYFVHWVAERKDKELSLDERIELVESVMPAGIRQYLEPVWNELCYSLDKHKYHRKSDVAAFVKKANASSVYVDINLYQKLGLFSGVRPLEELYLLWAIRKLLNSGRWSYNLPDSEVFLVENLGAFVDANKAFRCPMLNQELCSMLGVSNLKNHQFKPLDAFDSKLLFDKNISSTGKIVSNWVLEFDFFEEGSKCRKKLRRIDAKILFDTFEYKTIPAKYIR